MMTLEDALRQSTTSVPDAGRLFYGLGQNASYNAAKAGQIETIQIGARLVVPVAPLAAKLGLRANIGAVA